MKRFFLLFSKIALFFSICFLTVNYIDEASRNYALNLSKKFYVREKVSYTKVGIILCREDYFYNEMYLTNEYGQVDKLKKIGDLWVGHILSYEESDKKIFTYQHDNAGIYFDMFKDRLKKYKGYFIIGEGVEQFGMSLEEVVEYLKVREIEFKDTPTYYVKKFGYKKDLASEALNKKLAALYGEENIEKTFIQKKKIRMLLGVIGLGLGILGVAVFRGNRDEE